MLHQKLVQRQFANLTNSNKKSMEPDVLLENSSM